MDTNITPDQLALALNTLLGEPDVRERLAEILAGPEPRKPQTPGEWGAYHRRLAHTQVVLRTSATPGPHAEGRMGLGFYSSKGYAENLMWIEISEWDGKGKD